MEGKEKKVKEKKSKGKTILLILIIVLLLVIIGGGSYFGYKILTQSKPAAAANTKAVPEYTFAQDEFLINLSDTDSSRYVKVKVYLGFDKKKLTEELTTKKAAIRDTVITVLRSKKAADFSGSGTDAIKSEILSKVNPLLKNGQIEEVYFYDILVQ